MDREILFAKTLEKVRQTAKEQNNCITKEQVEKAFLELSLSKEQMDMVYQYLHQHKIGVGEAVDLDDYLQEDEKDYLDSYLRELEQLEQV